MQAFGRFWRESMFSLLAATTCAGTLPAEEATPGEAKRTVVYNGESRWVDYNVEGLPPSLQAQYRMLATAENELSLTRQLGMLKMEYVTNERTLEAGRTQYMLKLYSGSLYRPWWPQVPGNGFGGGGFGGGGYGFGGGGFGFGGGGYGGRGYGGLDQSLLKAALAPGLAAAANPDYRVQVILNLKQVQEALLEAAKQKAAAAPPKGGVPQPRALAPAPQLLPPSQPADKIASAPLPGPQPVDKTAVAAVAPAGIPTAQEEEQARAREEAARQQEREALERCRRATTPAEKASARSALEKARRAALTARRESNALHVRRMQAQLRVNAYPQAPKLAPIISPISHTASPQNFGTFHLQPPPAAPLVYQPLSVLPTSPVQPTSPPVSWPDRLAWLGAGALVMLLGFRLLARRVRPAVAPPTPPA